MNTKLLHFVLLILLFLPFTLFSQTNFHEYYKNPVFKGTQNTWDAFAIINSSIIFDGEKYHMYYTAKPSAWDVKKSWEMDIGYASSEDGLNWEKFPFNPIFKHNTDNWEKYGLSEPMVLKIGNKWHMWYVAHPEVNNEEDVNFYLGYASSSDGFSWKRHEEKLNFEKGEDGWDAYRVLPIDVVFNGSKFMLYYAGQNLEYGSPLTRLYIGVAESEDGITWTKDEVNNPVLTGGEVGSFNENIWNVDVIYDEKNIEAPYQMWYIGFNDTDKDRVYLATSKDGKIWNKYEAPLFNAEYTSWSTKFFNDIEVVKNGDRYQLWVNGYCNGETPNIGIGYFEDFYKCMHCNNIVCNTSYNQSGGPPEKFSTTVCNVNCTNYQVWGRVTCDETQNEELYQMYPIENGSSIFQIDEPVKCNGESFFTFSSLLKNSSTGEIIFDSRNFNMDYKFTTAGPISVVNYEVESVTNDDNPLLTKFLIKNLELKNNSRVKKILNVSVNLTSSDTNVINIPNPTLAFGHLEPQTTRKRNFSLALEAITGTDKIDLTFEITSLGVTYWTEPIVINTPVGIDNTSSLPTEYALIQNYPNPFNPSTLIKYSIPTSDVMLNSFQHLNNEIPGQAWNDNVNVTLRIYDILGREVTTLVNEKQKPGYYEVEWNASNNSSGVYFYKLTSGDFEETKKMILIR